MLREIDEVAEAVYTAIGEVTGYPRSFLERGGDLEADLGVDSIRKLEILGALEHRLGVRADPSDTARLAGMDVAALIAWARAKQDGPAASALLASFAHFYQPTWLPAPWTPSAVPFEPGLVRRDGAWWVRPSATGATPERARQLVNLLVTTFRAAAPGPIAAWLSDDPADAAVAGFVRSLAREWGTEARILFGDADPGVWGTLLASPPGTWRWRGDLAREVDVAVHPEPAFLPDRPVVLAIGGTDGILGACLDALPGAVGVVLSRRLPSTIPDGFVHVAGDARRPEVVAEAAALARRHGRIDLVIHAAGVLADRKVGAVVDADISAVLGAKLEVAAAAMAATVDDRPLWVPFTSLAGIVGNAGQTVYSAANAVLDAWPHPTGRSTPIAWSAWSQRGMARDLGPVLARLGVVPLSPDEGARAFRSALHLGPVRIAAHPVPSLDTAPLRIVRLGRHPATVDAIVTLDPSDSWLGDHAPLGRPLVPYAGWVTLARKAAAILGLSADLSDARVLGPAPVSAAWDARVTVRDGEVRISHGETPLFTARLAAHAAPIVRSGSEPRQQAATYYRSDLLFHGNHWRVLDLVSSDGAAATIRLPDGTEPESAMIDAIWQLVAVRAHLAGARPGLPVSAERLGFGPPAEGLLTLRLEGSDAVISDAAGRVVAHAGGLATREV